MFGTIEISLRFYGNLNDLISYNPSGITVDRHLPEPTSVKDLIEGCGVPHTEVDLILVQGQSVDFSYLVKSGQRVSVYPFFHSMDIPETDRLQKTVLSHNRFLADVHLGKLTRYLRLAGFDTAYHTDATDDDLIEQMLKEQRILLSRDRKLLMRKVVNHGYLPRSDDPSEQLHEVFHRFNLFDKVDAYSRCPNCNGPLYNVDKEKVLHRLEPLTKRHYDKFSQCSNCGQIYWAGSHHRRLDDKIRDIIGADIEV